MPNEGENNEEGDRMENQDNLWTKEDIRKRIEEQRKLKAKKEREKLAREKAALEKEKREQARLEQKKREKSTKFKKAP